MSKPIFYEGQEVGCLIFGEGKVTEITDVNIYVDYGDCIRTYNSDGSYFYYSRPILYPIDQYREIIANLPAPQPEPWKPKPGEWCWFWNVGHVVRLEQFAELLTPSLRFKTKKGNWFDNCAPFTGELPEHLKEVQP